MIYNWFVFYLIETMHYLCENLEKIALFKRKCLARKRHQLQAVSLFFGKGVKLLISSDEQISFN